MAGKSQTERTRKKEPLRIRYATYLPREVIDKIRRAAYHMQVSTGEVIEAAVVEFINKAEKKHGKPFGPITRLRPGRPLREA